MEYDFSKRIPRRTRCFRPPLPLPRKTFRKTVDVFSARDGKNQNLLEMIEMFLFLSEVLQLQISHRLLPCLSRDDQNQDCSSSRLSAERRHGPKPFKTDAMDFCRVSECTKTKLNTADCDGLAASKPPNSKNQTLIVAMFSCRRFASTKITSKYLLCLLCA
jgi:hypothetical protein